MSTVVFMVTGLGLYLLYQTALQGQKTRLSQTAKTQALLLESMYDTIKNPEIIENTVAQASKEQDNSQTATVDICKLLGNQIILINDRTEFSKKTIVPLSSNLAQAMHKALQGYSGITFALDHRGIKVLAAYEPVEYLHWGVVAKVDLAELRAPYIQTGIYTLLWASVLNGLGGLFLWRLCHPMAKELQQEKTIRQDLENRIAKHTDELAQINQQFHQEITERQRLEEVREREIDLLARIMETSPVGILMVNPNGDIVIASEQAEKMLGLLKTEQGYQMPPWRVSDEAGNLINDQKHLCKQVMEGRQSIYDVREMIEFADGSHILVSINGSPVFDETTRLEGVVFTVEDITERFQVETALLHSETQFRAIFEQASVGIGIVALSGQFIRVNQRYCELTGYSEAELQEKTYQDILHPEDFNPNTDTPDMNNFSVEKRYIRKDNSIIWIHLSGSIVKDQNGQPMYIVGVVEDITERKQAITALKESEERYRRIIETTAEGVWSIDLNNRTTFVNQRMAQMLGYTVEEMLGRSILEFTDTEDQVMTLQKLAPHQQEITESHDLKFLCKDGKSIWTMISTNSIFDAEGNYAGALGMLTDITERKQTEKALQQANIQLIEWNRKLQQRNQEILLLNQISDFLQACLSVEEAYQVIGELLPTLFTGYQGAVFIINETSNLVEAVATWGEDLHSKTLFTADECWALRRGKIHWVHEQSHLRCQHVHHNVSTAYNQSLCVPMMAQGKAIGLLYLCYDQCEPISPTKQQLAQTVAEHLSLALANLNLRETLQAQSIIDPLTNLYNRRYMEEALKREINLAKRKRHPVGIMMLDVDHFRQFNATFGHEGGNCVLKAVGSFLSRHIRSGDIACRYGGEEFLLILPEASLEISLQRAEQIRQGLKQMQVSYGEQLLSQITVSIGLACFPDHGKTIEELIKSADFALYQAKNAGRDRVVRYTVDL
ncbi:PAS domain S-box protein [Chroococcus sp. FPU101]|uniref:sensor domain-containing diguanylate cyclase n=1 Tax=Chroococcus sp. FPU101 TaxID=1974212 RepID=UPI001F5DF776|nr:PAS domain S-box protein [Chroococcus sp. FPU101]